MDIRTLLRPLGALALATLATTACGGGPPLAQLGPVSADSEPVSRTLRPGDIVKVQVFGHDELSGEFPIDENDSLLLPIVGGFSIKDMTVADLRGRIRREYGQLYTQSFVSVTPLFRVAVLGEVVRPGLYSVDPTMTIYQVLAQAGGALRTGKENGMRLIRGGQQFSVPVNAAALASATLRELGVRSGDQIVVPRRAIPYETWLIVLQLLNVALVGYTVFRK
jgi:protein involved in polysaccharide export with SLBB domain